MHCSSVNNCSRHLALKCSNCPLVVDGVHLTASHPDRQQGVGLSSCLDFLLSHWAAPCSLCEFHSSGSQLTIHTFYRDVHLLASQSVPLYHIVLTSPVALTWRLLLQNVQYGTRHTSLWFYCLNECERKTSRLYFSSSTYCIMNMN